MSVDEWKAIFDREQQEASHLITNSIEEITKVSSAVKEDPLMAPANEELINYLRAVKITVDENVPYDESTRDIPSVPDDSSNCSELMQNITSLQGILQAQETLGNTLTNVTTTLASAAGNFNMIVNMTTSPVISDVFSSIGLILGAVVNAGGMQILAINNVLNKETQLIAEVLQNSTCMQTTTEEDITEDAIETNCRKF